MKKMINWWRTKLAAILIAPVFNEQCQAGQGRRFQEAPENMEAERQPSQRRWNKKKRKSSEVNVGDRNERRNRLKQNNIVANDGDCNERRKKWTQKYNEINVDDRNEPRNISKMKGK